MSFNNYENQHDEVMAEINMTPLIDIMLVLLIIFMVTSSVTVSSGVDIDLPSANQSKPIEKKENDGIIISLNNKGIIFIQGIKSSTKTLGKDIKSALDKYKTKLVIFEGDQQATLGKAIHIIDIAKKVGATKFAIATEEK